MANKTRWKDIKHYRPEIDYQGLKSAVKVQIKVNGRPFNCYYRLMTFEDKTYGIFYDLKTGHIFKNIKEWRYNKI